MDGWMGAFNIISEINELVDMVFLKESVTTKIC